MANINISYTNVNRNMGPYVLKDTNKSMQNSYTPKSRSVNGLQSEIMSSYFGNLKLHTRPTILSYFDVLTPLYLAKNINRTLCGNSDSVLHMCGSEWGSEWNPMAEEMGIARGSGIGDCQKVHSYSNTPTTILLLR